LIEDSTDPGLNEAISSSAAVLLRSSVKALPSNIDLGYDAKRTLLRVLDSSVL
jgi:hypothetical protein